MSAKQRKIRAPGQPAPRWPQFMNAAHARIVARGGFKTRGKHTDPLEQIAAEIVRHGDGSAFLKAVRRGRPTARQNIRYQLLREVEGEIGAAVPRRREDRNTPEALQSRPALELAAKLLDTLEKEH
jgi:hypothetical protein